MTILCIRIWPAGPDTSWHANSVGLKGARWLWVNSTSNSTRIRTRLGCSEGSVQAYLSRTSNVERTHRLWLHKCTAVWLTRSLAPRATHCSSQHLTATLSSPTCSSRRAQAFHSIPFHSTLSKPRYECVEFISKHRGGYNIDKNALSNICTTSSSPQKDNAALLIICCCIFSFSPLAGDTMHSTLLQQWVDIFTKTHLWMFAFKIRARISHRTPTLQHHRMTIGVWDSRSQFDPWTCH